jgi:hypothetical protein
MQQSFVIFFARIIFDFSKIVFLTSRGRDSDVPGSKKKNFDSLDKLNLLI